MSWVEGATIRCGRERNRREQQLTPVLNISGCGLTALPATLAGLKGLKALVAMNNEWTGLDDAVVGEWKELNSLSASFASL